MALCKDDWRLQSFLPYAISYGVRGLKRCSINVDKIKNLFTRDEKIIKIHKFLFEKCFYFFTDNKHKLWGFNGFFIRLKVKPYPIASSR